MTRDQYLALLEKKGLLEDGVKSGVVNYVHIKHAEIRKKFAKMKPENGYVKTVCMLAYEYKLSEAQIKAVVR